MLKSEINENLKDIYDRIERINRLGSLKMLILHVLEHGHKNGVEIMDAVEKHNESFFRHMHENVLPTGHGNEYKSVKLEFKRPSPGSVYPMLKKMVNENLIIKQDDGTYKITGDGLKIVYKLFGPPKDTSNSEKAMQYVLSEISLFVLYLEDFPKEKLSRHREIVKELIERLKKIEDSFEDE